MKTHNGNISIHFCCNARMIFGLFFISFLFLFGEASNLDEPHLKCVSGG